MNEIPISIFILMAVVDFVFLILSFLIPESFKPQYHIDVVFAALSSGVSFLLANMILSGNVVFIQSDGVAFSYIPIQSIPLNYVFTGLGVSMALTTALFIYQAVHEMIEKEKSFSALGEWDKV